MASLEKQVGAIIRYHRERAGLSQARLAELIERQVGTLSRIERGESAPSFKTLERLASVLNLAVRDFFELGEASVRSDPSDPVGTAIKLIASADADQQRKVLRLIEGLLSDD
jgi:transcriptional regulator with XRE-family HTH domain